MLDQADRSIEEVSEFLASFGVRSGFLVPTPTGLSHSVMDAHAQLREYLLGEGLHDYSSQGAGEEAKVQVVTWLMGIDGVEKTSTSLYRPASNGDPRIWVRGVKGYAEPGNVLAVLVLDEELYIVNASRPGLLDTANDPGAPLGGLLRSIGQRRPVGTVHASSPRPAACDGIARAVPSESQGTNEAPDLDFSSLARLQQRAFGGEDVAVRPDARDLDWWPKGPLLPGVSELIADLAGRVASTDGLNVYFLLGGAGNGKSFAARALAQRLGIVLESDVDGLARRIYGTRCGDVEVILLNDATIAPANEYNEWQSFALAADIDRWWRQSASRPIVAFCCVNRGIIIDELRALAGNDDVDKVPRAVLHWLSDPDSVGLAQLGPDDANDHRPALSLGDQYRERSVSLGGRALRLFSLAVDASSLLDANELGMSPGVSLMGKVLSKCSADVSNRPPLCPIKANVQQLRATGGIERWGALLGAAEIASGRLLSYRDLWGLIVLSMLGPRAAGGTGSESSTLGYIDECLLRLAGAEDAGSRLEPLLLLSRFRFHNAIFRAASPFGPDAIAHYPPSTPFHTGFAMLDPSAWGSIDSREVESAMQAIAMGDKPSGLLRNASAKLDGVWSPYDEALEDALVAFVVSDACPDVVRRRLVSWFGGYVIRLVCTASGSLGNADALRVWAACHRNCANGTSPLPMEFQDALNGLLFPVEPGVSSHNLLVPALASRTEPLPLTRNGRGAMLAESIDHSSLALRVRRGPNRLTVECTRAGSQEVVGQLALDFALVREALAWRKGRVGQTEVTNFVEPRLERCRAASLASLPDAHRRLVALVDGSLKELRQ